jgi:hypothetical protein
MGSAATTRVTARVTMATTKAAATTAAATTTAATTAAATTAAAASMAARAKLKVTFDRWGQPKRSVQVIDFNLFPTFVKVLAKCLQIIFAYIK